MTPIDILALGLLLITCWTLWYHTQRIGFRHLRRWLDDRADARARVLTQDELLQERYLDSQSVVSALHTLSRDMERAREANADLTRALAEERRARQLAEGELARRPQAHPIVRAVHEAGHPLTVGQVARHLDLDLDAVRRQAEILIAGGQLEPWVLREGPATEWQVIGYQQAARADTVTSELETIKTLRFPTVRTGGRSVLAGAG